MARPQHRPRRKRRKSWLGRILFVSACLVAIFAIAVTLAAPWILREVVPDAFARVGLQASVTGGGISLVRREVTLQGLVVGAPESPAVSLSELGLGLGVRELVRGRIRLRHIRIRDVELDVERLLALREQLATGTGSTSGGLPFELDELELKDIRLLSTSERIGHDVRIVRLRVGDPSALAAQRPSSVSLQGSIGDGDVDLQLEVDLDADKLQVSGSYRIDALPLRGLVRLASENDDPFSSGAFSARGDLRSEFALQSRKLNLIVEGSMSLAGLGAETQSLKTEHGNADWRGRMVIGWSPDMDVPELRGDGSLEVQKLQLTHTPASREPIRATIDDVSWQGDFHFRNGLTTQGAVLGTVVEVSDASRAMPAWQVRGEDFSSRLDATGSTRSGAFDVGLKDFDLARLFVAVSDHNGRVEVSGERFAFDELRRQPAGDMALGKATFDTLTISKPGGAATTGGMTIGVNRVTAAGLSGDDTGMLHAKSMSVESLDFARAERSARADKIDITDIGLNGSAQVAARSMNVESARLNTGKGDIWLSDMHAKGVRSDAGDRFGAETLEVEEAFQSGDSGLAWDANGLRLSGIDGDVADVSRVSAVDLARLRVVVDDAAWEGSALHTSGVVIPATGGFDTARVGFDSLEYRQPSTADVRVSSLDGRGLRSRDGRASLESVAIASLDCRLPSGLEIAASSLEARMLSGDADTGVAVAQVTIVGGEARDVDAARLTAKTLEGHGLSVARAGDVAADRLSLARLSRTAPEAATLDLEGLDVAALKWAPGAALSVAKAAVDGARLGSADDRSWALSQMQTDYVVWDGGARVGADRLAVASLSQDRDQSRDWLVESLQAVGLALTLPEDISVATVAADSVEGGDDSLTWKLASVVLEGLSSTASAGESVDRFKSGEVEVSDAVNGALLTFERAEAQPVAINVLDELSAGPLTVGGLRLASRDPDWASRLSATELRVDATSLHVGGLVELEEVVVRNPYVVVAQSADNQWMWPPIPGGGARAGDDSKMDSSGGIRVGRFSTRGPGRIVYIDRATEPVFQLALDPLVVAIENLDTRLPGNRSRFRLRGTSHRFAGFALQGQLIKGVHGFDLAVDVHVTGAYLPELNPYVARQEPIAITQGWGDMQGTISIENGRLNGRLEMLLSGLQLRRTVGGTQLPRITPANLTFSAALALLKDRQGNIRFSVPLEAQIEEPDYDFVDNLQQAIVRTVRGAGQAAVNVTVRTFDAALDLIGSTVSVLPGVDTTRYPPIVFPPGNDDITARHLEYLNQLADRMLRHESLVLALCGRAVPADAESISAKKSSIDKLFAEASKGVYRLYAADRDRMLALADARADTVRRYLRGVRDVPNAQIVPCDPEVDEESDAMPRVQIDVKSRPRRGLFGLFP